MNDYGKLKNDSVDAPHVPKYKHHIKSQGKRININKIVESFNRALLSGRGLVNSLESE